MNEGKQRLIEVLNKRKYHDFNSYFCITFGSYNDIDCGFVSVNDAVICVVVKDNDVVPVCGDEIRHGYKYSIDEAYMHECLSKVYSALV